MTKRKLYLSPIEALTNQLKQKPRLNGAAGGPDIIPTELLREAYNATYNRPGCHDYPGMGGSPEARQAISEYAAKILGLPKIPAEKIIVTAGAQHALKLLSQILLDIGDKALVENPGFVEGRMPIEYQTNSLEAINITIKGEVTIPARGEYKLAYTVPTAHNPLGIDYPPGAREKLRELASKGVVVIEDDPYRALHLDPPETVWRPGSNIAYVGSLSKTVAPGIRTGFIIPPEDLLEPLELISQHDFATNTPIGCMLEYLLDKADLEEHIKLKRRIYVERLEYLKKRLGEEIPWAEQSPARGGFFVTIRLGCDPYKVLEKAVGEGLTFVPIRDFYVKNPVHDAVRISIAKMKLAEIDEYTMILGRLVSECHSRSRPGG